MPKKKGKKDEENRLQAIDDNGFVSNYWYDAAGERTVKTSGESQHMYVNSVFSGGDTQTADFTVYINPYLVVSKGGQYTKHIYIGSQRIVSKLGDLDSYGSDPRRIEYAGANVDGAKVDYASKYEALQQTIKDRYATFEVPYYGKDNDDYVNGQGFCCDDTPKTKSFAANVNDNPELFQYYYHSDHLGSSSLITNLDGEIVQHIEYVPFGEVFIEERNSTWNTPYLFNAKELDEETGLYYYGARYYDPRTSIWLFTDPMQEKYPNISTYAYCAQNPVKFIDPTGMDWVFRYAEGKYEAYYDRDVRSQKDVYRKYGSDTKTIHLNNGANIKFYNGKGEMTGDFTFKNDSKENKYGTVTDGDGKMLSNNEITEGTGYRIFGTSDDSVDASTLYQNFFGSSYIGGNNPKTYKNKENERFDSYQFKPIGEAEAAAYQHDLDYDRLGATGSTDAFFNKKTGQADRDLANRCKAVMNNPNLPKWDRNRERAIYVLFSVIAKSKGK